MSRSKTLILTVAVFAITLVSSTQEAQAGPLLDWIRGLRNGGNNNSCCQQAPTQNYSAYSPAVAQAAPNAYGLQPGQCMKTCQQTCSRTVVNYVPQTAYRTNWKRVPVTTYKPVTNSDPCTGCTVTCMRPCTTYSYQCQRVPYTTYKPVYRTETYKVPVTTITNDCATGTCNSGCNTCAAPTVAAPIQNYAPVQNYAPAQNYGQVQSYNGYNPNSGTVTGTYLEYPNSQTPTSAPVGGTLTTEGGYGTTQPAADLPPVIDNGLNGLNPQTSNRPIIDRMRNRVRNFTTQNQPKTYSPSVAQSPVRREWDYSPVRLASYTKAESRPRTSMQSTSMQRTSMQRTSMQNNFAPIRRQPTKKVSGWVEVE